MSSIAILMAPRTGDSSNGTIVILNPINPSHFLMLKGRKSQCLLYLKRVNLQKAGNLLSIGGSMAWVFLGVLFP